MTKSIFKSAVTGKIVTEEYAKANPKETYKQTIKDCYTREELITAQEKYIDEFFKAPDKFALYKSGREAAEGAVDYLLSLVE